MPFVKLDTGILDSTLWVERECREVFITALLLAEPIELREPAAQLKVREMAETEFIVPPGWYGIVRAAGVGIARRALVDEEMAKVALEKLGAPDPESRSADFQGRRLVRVDGGFIVLNYFKYRDRDYTAAVRQQRYRERKKGQNAESRNAVTSQSHTVISRIAEAEAEAEADVKSFSPLDIKPKSKTRRKPEIPFSLPAWIDPVTWHAYETMRAKIKKPMTEHAKQLVVLELDKLRKAGADPQAPLDQSIRTDWQDVYPPKLKGNSQGKPQRSLAESLAAEEVAKQAVQPTSVRPHRQPGED